MGIKFAEKKKEPKLESTGLAKGWIKYEDGGKVVYVDKEGLVLKTAVIPLHTEITFPAGHGEIVKNKVPEEVYKAFTEGE